MRTLIALVVIVVVSLAHPNSPAGTWHPATGHVAQVLSQGDDLSMGA